MPDAGSAQPLEARQVVPQFIGIVLQGCYIAHAALDARAVPLFILPH